MSSEPGPVLQKAAHIAGAFVATFEAIAIHSALARQLAVAPLQGLLMVSAILAALIWRTRPADVRIRFLSQVAVTASVVGVVSALLLSTGVAETQGIPVTAGPLVKTVLLLVFQLGWAVTHWISVNRRRVEQGRYIPAAIGTVALIGGGLMTGGEATTALTANTAANGVVFKHFATHEDFAFARETERVGEESGSSFAHYHTGRQPLIGFSFETKEWFGRERISDLVGLFEEGDPSEGAHRIEARPGYVVAGVEVQADDHVNAIRVEFAPLEGEFFGPDGWYWSEWVGSYERGGSVERLDSGTELVVGLRGARGIVLNSLSLLTAQPSE